MPKEVFVSYGRSDAAKFADALCARLTAEGHTVWRDIDMIRYGDSWMETIIRSIGSCDEFIAVLSNWAMRNPNSTCMYEINEAASVGRPIIPVRIDECQTHFRVRSRPIIDMHNWNSEKQLTEGLDLILHVISTMEFPSNAPRRE